MQFKPKPIIVFAVNFNPAVRTSSPWLIIGMEYRDNMEHNVTAIFFIFVNYMAMDLNQDRITLNRGVFNQYYNSLLGD
jgi:hypothetical protein